MSTVRAAIDDSAAARPVLATAHALGALWDAAVQAVQVTEDGGSTARAAADAAEVIGDPRRAGQTVPRLPFASS